MSRKEEVMPVTVGVNKPGLAHKASNGISVVFPDVCKTPTPAGPIPIPYPNTATTALRSQQKLPLTGQKSITTSSVPKTVVNESGTLKGVAAMEQMQLQGRLNQLNARLQSLRTRDPNEWQKVLTEYAVLASALYRTLYPDD
jgi:Domain of unknown function (DUF4150)